jgi:hypothetical protein
MSNFSIVDPHGRNNEQRAEYQAKIEKVNAEARANWDNPAWRRSMAQQMTEQIYWGFQHENLLSLLAETENLPFEGRSFVKETRGLRAFWVARGGYIEASTIHSEVMEIVRDTIGFQVYEFEDKLMTNFAETSSTLVDLGIQRLDAEVNKRVLDTFEAAATGSSLVNASSLTLPILNSALSETRDESRSFNVSIVGRAPATEAILDQLLGGNGSGFIPASNESMVKTGLLGVYRGANIITLKNWKDDVDVPFFPANELYVVATDASKFAFFGGLMSKEWVEDENWYWHYLARRDFGGVVHRPERLRRIIIDDIDA